MRAVCVWGGGGSQVITNEHVLKINTLTALKFVYIEDNLRGGV